MELQQQSSDDDQIPPFFICPISLQIMRDPVTLPTGITYDRDSIEEWLFSSSSPNSTCPVTKQPISDHHLTPNTTLRRLIQSWCSAHPEQQPLPSSRHDPDLPLLLHRAPSHPASLRLLRDLVSDCPRARRSALRHGAPRVVLAILDNPSSTPSAVEDSLSVFNSLRLPEGALRELSPGMVNALTRELTGLTHYGRALAVAALHSVVRASGANGLGDKVFRGVVGVINDRASHQGTKAALRLLREAVPVGRNRVRAVEAGAVEALVELLLEGPENRVVEMAMTVLEMLCGCAEGREALIGHAAGLAVVAGVLMTVSEGASEKAVRVLWWVGKFAIGWVVEEMALVGAVAKLCYLAQAERGAGRLGEKAKEVLGMHSRVWRRSPCVPQRLLGV